MYKRGNPGLRSRPSALRVILVSLSILLSAQLTHAAGNLLVDEFSGAVKVLMQERWQTPATGMNVSLPAVVSTGGDGAVTLRQDEMTISVAANTAIELLEGPVPGQPLQRVVQNQGSAFYDISPRGASKLRVETPYLVAVIKGTQFNVTVAEDSSSIALFEGQLQIEAPDVGDVVDLFEGQMARRSKGDPRITVLKMENGEPVSRGGASSTSSGDEEGRNSSVAGDTGASGPDGGNTDDTNVGGDVDIATGAGSTGVEVSSAIQLGNGSAAVAGSASLQVGDIGAAAGVDTALQLEGGSVNLDAGAGVDIGDNEIDVGVDTDVDLGSGDLDLNAGVDLGGASIDVDTDVDLGSGDVDIDAGIGGIEVDVDLDLDGGLGDTLDDLLGESDTGAEVEDDGSDDLLPDLGDLLGL